MASVNQVGAMATIRILMLFLAVTAIVSCGGGGGGGGGGGNKSSVALQSSSAKTTTSSVISSRSSAANIPPVANAGPDISVMQLKTATLDGSQSLDTDGSIVSYQWTVESSQIRIDNANAAVARFTAPAMNTSMSTYAELTVTDNQGASHTDRVQIVITGKANNIPVANAGPDKQANPNTLVDLDGTASTDEGGAFMVYRWEQVSGPRVEINRDTSAHADFRPSELGTYVFRLTVRDDDLSENVDTVTIEVINNNQLPTITLPTERILFDELELAVLPALVVSDADGSIVKYQWVLDPLSEVDIEILNADQFRASFNVPALTESRFLYFRLTVTDDKNGSVTSDRLLVEIKPVEVAPTANAGESQTLSAGVKVVLDASKSLDSDGRIVSYQWKQIFGTPVTLTAADSVAASFIAPTIDGLLMFQVTAIDNHGNEDTDIVHIDIAAGLRPKASRKAKPARLEITWNQGVDADQFNIYFKKNKTVGSSTLASNPDAKVFLNEHSPFVLDATMNEYMNTHFTVEAIKNGKVVKSETVTTDIQQVGLGNGNGCLLSGRTVNCWGIVDDTTIKQLANPRSISVGYAHACALDDTGVKCWGDDLWGETHVPPLRNPKYVIALRHKSCAIDDSGWHCWGSSSVNLPDVANPTAVSDICVMNSQDIVCNNEFASPPELTSPRQLSVSIQEPRFACALDATGVKCWGYSHDGQTNVPGLVNPKHVSAGLDHACALDDTGVVCWGGNDRGQINVPELKNPTQVVAGNYTSCAVDDTGLVCWGTHVGGIPSSVKKVDQIKLAENYCARDGSKLYCWGPGERSADQVSNFDISSSGYYCNIENNKVVCRDPATVPLLTSPTLVATGHDFGCAVGNEGVKCWGSDTWTQQTSIVVGRTPALTGITELDAGTNHACAIASGKLECWGNDLFDVLKIPTTSNPHGLAIGASTSCVVDGQVKCWGGGNSFKQLDVPVLLNPRLVSVGQYSVCALDDEGVHCWGGVSEEDQVPSLYNPRSISSGVSTNCAIDDFGLVCWGGNAFSGFGWRMSPRY